MKNKKICDNCNSENDFYQMNCSNCGALLRNKEPNIDLFATMWRVIETPTEAFKNIIFSEHKNYSILILFLISLKFISSSFFLQSIFISPVNYSDYFGINLLIGFGGFFLLLLLFPFFIKLFLKSRGVKTRFKDNLAIILFSQTPLILFLIIILPVEFALFGKFWLFSNPSPFLIKGTLAYFFSILELLTMVWSLILFGIAFYIQTKSKVFSVFVTIFFSLILSAAFFFIPYLD